MYCYKCGSTQRDGVKFCGSCGARQPTGRAEASPPVSAVVPVGAPGVRLALAPAASSVTIQTITFTASPPDNDGDVALSCNVIFTYHGEAPVPLVWLRMVVSNAESWPLAHCGTIRVESTDIVPDDAAEIQTSLYIRPAAFGTTADKLLGHPALVLYPARWQALSSFALPEPGARAGTTASLRLEELEVISWSVTPEDLGEDSAQYRLSVRLANRSSEIVAVALVRLVLRNREGEDLVVETVYAEGLASGEERLLEATATISENARARKGTTAELMLAASTRPFVVAGGASVPVILESEELVAEDGQSDEDAGDVNSANAASDDDVDRGEP